MRYSFATLSLLFFLWSSVPVIAQPLSNNSSLTTVNQSITPYLNRAIEQITEFKLDNGMKFIVMENHDAPVVSFVTYANVGGVDEPDGKTGVAHFLEHLAFKGTKDIGTTNYAAEKPLLERLDTLFSQMKVAQAAGKIKEAEQLVQEFQKVQTEANQYVQQNAFGQIVTRAGGVALNAGTSIDWTSYFYNFPSNKLELWMSLESERFLEPVFREFYKEQNVVLEERHLRTDNSPLGKMLEAFLDIAFTKHPYKRPVIGYNQDIIGLTREDVRQFFETYYVPDNLTFAIVGDVSPKRVKQLAQVYFSRYSAQPKPPRVTEIEPPQTETKEVTLELLSQPWYFEGYHRPAITHPDNAVYEVMANLLTLGRTSRLYKSLVEEKKVALVARGVNGFPGDKYPSLLLFYAQTAPNSTVDQVGKALEQEIERLKQEFVTDTELQRVKTQLRAALVRSLDSNLGMAQSLVEYEVKTGSWRNLFDQLTAIEAVSAADIKRVADQTFIPENKTIGRILSKTK
jgi:predicted Zn-dependent peptidase